jgi:hypothetical protein
MKSGRCTFLEDFSFFQKRYKIQEKIIKSDFFTPGSLLVVITALSLAIALVVRHQSDKVNIRQPIRYRDKATNWERYM